MSLFGSIFKAVAGPVIGGLFGKKDKPQTTTSTVNYVAMRDNAIKGGFNPLTALRNGGSAGHTTQTTSGGAMSSRGFIGEALSSGLQSAFAYDPNAEYKAGLETDIMEAQLENIQASTYKMNHAFGNNLPSATGRQRVAQTAPLVTGKALPFEAMPATVTNPWKNASVNPNYSDAEAGEARYAEIGAEAIGLRNAVVDTYHNSPNLRKWKWNDTLYNRTQSKKGFEKWLADANNPYNQLFKSGGRGY